MTPEANHTPEQDVLEPTDSTAPERDIWETHSFFQPVSSLVSPSQDPVTLDPETVRELNDELRDLDDARAAAAVAGRDYWIR